MPGSPPRFPNRWKHINKLRLAVLSLCFIPLVVLPLATVYQHFLEAHAYDMLAADQRRFYDVMHLLTDGVITKPSQFNLFKGTTWSATLFGIRFSDPLAVLAQGSAGLHLFWPLVLSAVLPVVVTLLFGRVFCGWICPANLLYEITDAIGGALRRSGFPVGRQTFDRWFKYLVLAIGMAASALLGTVALSAVYPPAVLGRELYYGIAASAIGAGSAFLALTLLFDLLVARRGFCRYLCPGGALYSLLGRFRLLRVQRKVSLCNDCTRCTRTCMFGLDPMADHFGQDCNNCGACIAVCPTGSLVFAVAARDGRRQGPGHLGTAYGRRDGTLP